MNKKRSPISIIIPVLIAAIVAAVAVVFVMKYEKTSAQTEPSFSAADAEGLNFITEMESVDTTPIEDRIFEEDNRQSVDELLAEFDSDPSAIWKTLKDYDTLIMGDSRAQCFLIYDFMDDAHCLVTHSTTIYKIEEYLPEVEARKPRVIVISYGINDTGLYHDYGVVNYMNDFAGLIEDLREVDPGVKIYVNSILPCLESEYERAPNWMVIPEWNEYIKNYCEEHEIGYIDATEICNQHRDLYIDDGVHLVEEFYPYWGALIAATIASDMSVAR
ncbi:MAG: SGNH/GDSL hydrolase family protein [Parasporobacterium sp.]|nr:SGNH/GDSL hydrolase family protein [Parasporobacterium sp.]